MADEMKVWFEEELLPAVFANPNAVAPEYGWEKDGAGWKATKGKGADHIVCHKPYGFLVHGGEAVPWLAYMNGGTFPRGEEWLRTVEILAAKVGMSLPEKDPSPEAKTRREAIKKERDLVENLVSFLTRLLKEAPEAEEARAYLQDRKLAPERWEVWGLGFMPKDTPHLVKWAEAGGWTWDDAKALLLRLGLLKEDEERRGITPFLHGRVVAPWRGPAGNILGWWGRKLPSAYEKAPKYLFTPGAWKTRPYLMDRIQAGEHLLLVEGVLDAIQCREHGFPAVALGGVGVDAYLIPLKEASPGGVVLVLDPDEAGITAARKSVAKILGAGIPVFLAELPLNPGGEKMDPDALLRTPNGPQTFRRLLDEAPGALRWKARDLVETHGKDGWTDQSMATARREALNFAKKLPRDLHPDAPELWDELEQGGLLLNPETMEEMVQGLREEEDRLELEKDRERREKATRAKVQEAAKKLERLVEDGETEEAHRVLLEEAAALQAEAFTAARSIPRVVLDEMDEHEARLQKVRGRNRLGMAQNSLQGLDNALLGLRGLMLLAGPPNCGKTSLAVQLGLGVLEAEEDAAVIILSLEQSRWEHLSRIKSHLSRVDWTTITLGSFELRDNPMSKETGDFYLSHDRKAIERGSNKLRRIGARLLILDDENYQDPTVEKIFREVEALKERTGASKVLVIVDYLQIWPVPPEVSKTHRTDLDKDKWQVGQLKTLKNHMGDQDAILAISEASKATWGEMTMGSVMGSARGTYTPDSVLVIQPVTAEDLAPKDEKDKKDLEAGRALLKEMVAEGRSPLWLKIVKGRDGVQREDFRLTFYFRQTRFAIDGEEEE